ncbi:CamS family sex pheromone protein [Ectobacillus ponti]|uniref:CamS family sex pheromone protein n=1 Tax=Ectobacillus ponti TaxID=2961894 RepID=A0AA41X9V9_9BACI|nr:CamS family sex pheromone protein [Ectobacillus ponti]MCP8969843.1 CamS family sex pheromone protein [Ectobacillus ponti]
MKKLVVLMMSLGLLLSGCGPSFQKNEKVVETANKSKESAIIPKYSISDDYYKTIVPFKSGAARGLVVQGLNSRLDIDEFETGLMRIAKGTFSTKDYIFQEGQYLDKATIQGLLARKNPDGSGKGLNPALPATGTLEQKNAAQPIYLASILEHNYVVKKSDNTADLQGIVIGLAMNSVHYFNQEQGYPREYEIPEADTLREGKRMAQEVVNTIRKKDGAKNVPIIVAIYRQQPMSKLVPGNFLTYAQVDKGESQIGDWKKLDEKYYLFPSEEAKDYREDAQRVTNFRTALAKYFENDFTAVVGQGFYKDGQLQDLKINIPVQFNGKAEIIGFTQYVTGLVVEHFPNYVRVEVNIYSLNHPEAVIIREVNQDNPFVHIFN